MSTAKPIDFGREREIQQLTQALRADPTWTAPRIQMVREELLSLLRQPPTPAGKSA